MIIIPITEDHQKFVAKYAHTLVLGDGVKGGFSNLSQEDLDKATREDFQYTGLYGELAWFIHRYGFHDACPRHKIFIDVKADYCKRTGKGDNGIDDIIIYNGKRRNVDIKTTHVDHMDRIKSLNLVIPEREFHTGTIYVQAFSLGENRRKVDKVILSGWEFNEDIKTRWHIDPKKWGVPVVKLSDIKGLDTFIR